MRIFRKRNFPQSELKELMTYNPETGVFTWNYDRSKKSPAGSVAGYKNQNGYMMVGIYHWGYTLHSLAWLYMTGNWPVRDIDHINGIRHDNRWSNLRDVCHSDNCCNRRTSTRNKTGFKGVSKTENGSFRVTVTRHNVNHYIGTFRDISEANQVAIEMRELLHGKYAKHK